MKKYRVEIYLDAPEPYDVGRVAAAVGLTFAEEAVEDLSVTRLDVEEWAE